MKYIPHMWVKRELSDEMEHAFSPKHDTLSSHINKQETDSIFYDVRAFRQMLAYFNSLPGIAKFEVMIASFSSESSTSVPSNYGSLLTLIFVPTDLDFKVLGYFTLPPGATAFDVGSCKLLPKVAKEWIANYKKQIKFLVNELDTTDRSNYPGGVIQTGQISDTRSISYPFSNLLEIDTEINYQATFPPPSHRIITTGIKAFFSAYSFQADGLANRLLVQFELTKDVNNKVYHLEDTYDFKHRHPYPKFTLYDNGQLCPPASGCPNP